MNHSINFVMIRRALAVPVLLLAFAATLAATPKLRPHLVHQDIAPLLSKLVLPKSCQEAYDMCERDASGMLVCPPLEKLLKQIEALTAKISGADDLSQPDPKAYQSRIAESNDIIKACNQLQTLMTGDEATKFNGTFNSDLSLEDTRSDDAHRNVQMAMQAAMDSCPKIRGGEGEYPDPACQKQKQHEMLVGHITAGNKYLQNVGGVYSEYLKKLTVQLSSIDAILAKTDYGAKAKTQIYLDQLTAAQAYAITTVQGLLTRYIAATNTGALNIQQLKDWERDNP
jgi:hypothetical protein